MDPVQLANRLDRDGPDGLGHHKRSDDSGSKSGESGVLGVEVPESRLADRTADSITTFRQARALRPTRPVLCRPSSVPDGVSSSAARSTGLLT
jgi:hypothetical protein